MDIVSSAGEWQRAAHAPLSVVFKYSPACGISAVAERELRTVMETYPAIPVCRVDVLGQRPLAQRIAAETGVAHASPQIIVLEHGASVWNASHFGISAALVNWILCRRQARDDQTALARCGPPPNASGGLPRHLSRRAMGVVIAAGVLVTIVVAPDAFREIGLIAVLALGIYLAGRVVRNRQPPGD